MKFEIRVAISPTTGFFRQVELLDYSLRRLGGEYAETSVTVVVGSQIEQSDVVRCNPWSQGKPVNWISVPTELNLEFGYKANSLWRYVLPPQAQICLFMDADTVFLREVDDLTMLHSSQPKIAGHVAHFPPSDVVPSDPNLNPPRPESSAFWPWMFSYFKVGWPENLFEYSIARLGPDVRTPAYFNGGFLATTRPATVLLGNHMLDTYREVNKLAPTYFLPQIARTLVTYRCGIEPVVLGGEYNAANDEDHASRCAFPDSDIRVLHYLRQDEFLRQEFLLPSKIEEFLSGTPVNSRTERLRRLVSDFYRDRTAVV